ncbi:MAG: GAF domain-containing protein, partial [Planctomycetaceae bacterium]|nr:GAF domain-containing protein [Planctomycetaceae bacterium]
MTVPVDAVSNNGLFETGSIEIEQLARSDVAESDFFSQLVAKLCSVVKADAGAVWLLDQNGMVNRVCESGFDALGLDQNRNASRLNIQYMLDAIQNGEPKVHSFRDDGESESPVDRPLLAVPIRSGDANVGVVELFLPPDSRAEDRLEQLQFVEEMCHHAGRYLAWRQQLTSPNDQLEFWDRFEQFQSSLHQSLDSSRITTAAVNDSRHLLDCDRVSIAVRRGPRTILVAVSGQESISQRSNAVSGLTALASEVIDEAQTVSYSGRLMAAPPHLERQLQDYSEASNSRTIVVIPLLESKLDQPDKPADELPRAFGVLIIEQFSAEWLTPLTAGQADLVAGHVSTALENARQHEGVLLLPLRRKLGRCFGLLAGRRLAVAGIVAALLACSIATLCIVPATYRVTGTGKLMPVVQRRVFAPWDGEVVAVRVSGGQQVEKGQALIELRNDDIAAQHVAVRNQLEAKTQHLTALEAAL